MPAALDTRMTTSEVARMVGVSEQSVRQWTRAGVLRAERTPLGSLYDPAEVGRLIAERERRQRQQRAGA